MIRDDIKAAQVAAMKSGDKARLGTIRLMLAKIKDKDIELRTGTAPADDDVLVTDVLQKWSNSAASRSPCSNRAVARNSPTSRRARSR